MASISSGGNLFNTQAAVTDSLNTQVAQKAKDAQQSVEDAKIAFQQSTIMMVGILVVSILVIVAIIGFTLKSIGEPVGKITRALEILQKGIIKRDTTQGTEGLVARKDEFGDMLRAYSNTQDYMMEMADVADRIGNNDLTVEFEPKCEEDMLGNAFKKMSSGLRSAINQVANSTRSLTAASTQLATASNNVGQATSQIATTIQQVARGTTQQSEAVSRTASSVEEMSRAINGVAMGAQDQAKATANASTLTGQL